MKKFTILMIAMLVAAMGFAQFQKMETSPFKKQVIYKHTRAANGIDLTSVTPANGATVEAGNITISGVVTNNGDENLTSYKISYKVDEEDAVEYAVSGIEVASGETHNFTHPSPAVLAAGTHSIVVTVSEPNDDTEFEAVSQTVNVTATEPVQDVVEIALTSVTPEDNATVTAGDVTITGVVKNNGNVALTSYTVSYTIGENPAVVSTINEINVEAEGEHTFTLTVAFEASETPYEIIVTVSEPNGVADGDDTDNSKTINLTVNEPVPPAANAITLAVNPTVNVTVGEDITITGTVTNTGTDALTSYKFSYTVDGGEAVDSIVTLTEAVATEGTHEFTFTVAAFAEAGTHSIVVTVSNPNNDTEFEALTQTINVTVSELVVQPAVAITLAVNPTEVNVNVDEAITITGTVTNTGTDALTTYKFSYAVDGGEAVDSTVTITEAVATEGTHEFTFTVAAFAEAGTHSIVVTVSNPNNDTEFEALTQTINVTVTEPTPATPEIALTSIAPATGTTVHTGQNISISGVVTNNGVALTSYKVSYTVDGGEAVEYEVSEIEVANGATHNFTHATPVVLSTEGAHTIVVTVSNPNGEEDGNAEDNSKTITLNAISCDAITTFPYTEGFENGIPQCWTIIDADGDGNNWMAISELIGEDASDYVHGGSNAAISESFRNNVGAYDADNWLITNAITVPAEGDYIAIWFAASLDTEYQDSYSVYIGTEPTVAAMTANTAILSHTPAEWEMKNISLAAYAGQTIYIGFNHADYDNYVLMIDDFSVIEAPTTPEIALTSVTPANGASVSSSQDITIGGVVTNNGVDLTSYKVSYTVDGGEAVEYAVSGINVTLGGTHNFTHTTPISGLATGAHTIVVTVSNPNGTADNTNDNSMTINITVTAPLAYGCYFETDPAEEGWAFVDSDNDGYNWTWENSSETPHMTTYEGIGCLYSQSYDEEALTPDNWAIAPAIEIEDGPITVSLYAKGQDASYAAEHFQIYAGTSNNVSAMTAVSDEFVATGEYTQYSATLPSSYVGQTIYVAIRHFNVSDEFVLVVDNFEVFAYGHVATDIEENIAETIAVYPNPTSSMVTIANAEGKDIVIVNSLGQVVANIENAAANQTIDVANFANGTYFVKVDGEVVKLNVVK